jgi:hypothetical protein
MFQYGYTTANVGMVTVLSLGFEVMFISKLHVTVDKRY